MPIEIENHAIDENIRDNSTFSLGVKVSDTGSPVTVTKCLPSNNIEPFITLQTPLPLKISTGEFKDITFKIRDKSKNHDGHIDIYFEDGGFFGIRRIKIALHPIHDFNGVFGLDFGSSRIAAAFIDPNNIDPNKDDWPTVVTFTDGENFMGSSISLEFSDTQVTGLLFHGISSPKIQNKLNVFYRPRQLVKKMLKSTSEQRNVTFKGGSKKGLINLSDLSGFALASCLKTIDRTSIGAPAKITIPISSSFSSEDISKFKDSISNAGKKMLAGLSGRICFHPNPKYILDEATSAAFYWIRCNQARLLQKKNLEFNLMVIDAGASSVDASILNLKLDIKDDRLKITPRILAIDSFSSLSGDNVTSLIANKLKEKSQRNEESRNDEDNDFFIKTWESAEKFKLNLKTGTKQDKSRQSTLITMAELENILENDSQIFKIRLDNLLIKNEAGDKQKVDHVFLTGGASPLEKLQNCVKEVIKNTTLEICPEGKEAVCKGAALVAFFHSYAKAFENNDSKSKLALDLSHIHDRLPYSIMYMDGNAIHKIFDIGTEFKSSDKYNKPFIEKSLVGYQKIINFYRMAGGRQYSESNKAIETLQFLGSVELPDTGPKDSYSTFLFSNHEIEVHYNNEIYKPKNKEGAIEPLLNFMRDLKVF